MDKNNRDYSNGEITVHWLPSKCVHSTICYSKLRKVFDPSRRPWIKMDEANTEQIIEIVNQCPTDALTFTRNKKQEKQIQGNEDKVEIKKSKNTATKIQIIKDGPALISGTFTITDINGINLTDANNIALCRCGQSSTMPFCDGSHNRIKFKENKQ